MMKKFKYRNTQCKITSSTTTNRISDSKLWPMFIRKAYIEINKYIIYISLNCKGLHGFHQNKIPIWKLISQCDILESWHF